MDKYSMQDVQNIHNTCFKLNSLQLNALMTNYHCAPDEPYIPPVRHDDTQLHSHTHTHTAPFTHTHTALFTHYSSSK